MFIIPNYSSTSIMVNKSRQLGKIDAGSWHMLSHVCRGLGLYSDNKPCDQLTWSDQPTEISGQKSLGKNQLTEIIRQGSVSRDQQPLIRQGSAGRDQQAGISRQR